MAECAKPSNVAAGGKTTFEKKKTLSKHLRAKKNLKKNKRKRNKARYYRTLKRRRIDRTTEDLCAEIEDCGVTDMEWAPSRGEPPEFSKDSVPPELAEWHKQDQIAYWKSRAISLELENHMLHKALRDVYAQNIVDYQKSMGTYQENNETNEQPYPNEEEVEEEDYLYEEESELVGGPGTVLYTAPEPSTSQSKNKSGKKKYENKPEEEEVAPKLPEGRNRLEKMREVYGDKAEKIMGMETAIQLNFERHEEQTQAIYWPNLPLKL